MSITNSNVLNEYSMLSLKFFLLQLLHLILKTASKEGVITVMYVDDNTGNGRG